MFIVIDGPEKAGKTTLARALVAAVQGNGLTAHYQHFSGAEPVTLEHLDQAMDQLDQVRFLVWDRSWASGRVYEDLGFTQKPEAIKEEGEVLFKELMPYCVMLLGPSAEELQGKRTPDDLPVPAAVERAAFAEYAKEHGWSIAHNPHTEESLEALIHLLTGSISRAY